MQHFYIFRTTEKILSLSLLETYKSVKVYAFYSYI